MKKIKVCGMRNPGNIRQLEALNPDFMGFIFYPKSPRFVGEDFTLPKLEKSIEKVGVFVKESSERILETARKYSFDYVQLHSYETPEFCAEIKKAGLKVLKAFAVDSAFDFTSLAVFEGVVDYFLFDTKGDGYGGHGVSFDWAILENYKLNIPFFIAGGISNQNIGELLKFHHPMFVGIDVNSRYEISPGLKDTEALKELFLTIGR